MKTKRIKIILILVGLLTIFSATIANTPAIAKSTMEEKSETKPQDSNQVHCRFGITSPMGWSEKTDLASLKVSAYLDWAAGTNPPLPGGVEYIRVLRVRNDLFAQAQNEVETLVPKFTGGVWVIGNEPDSTYEVQDAVTAEVYAQRFHRLATRIRALDPTARIGFGTIVQPTPMRLRYLEKAWKELVRLSGSQEAASALFDFYNIHAFILNEKPGEWGTGAPAGFENDASDAFLVKKFNDTYNIQIFENFVTAMRVWMYNHNHRNKMLWITEYGSLFPPVDPPDGRDLVNVSDEDTKNYMIATFDFLMTKTDDRYGLASDRNRLVQRWFWYSLNDHRYTFGGSLFDMDNNWKRTPVGDAYATYLPKDRIGVDYYVVGDISAANSKTKPGKTVIEIEVANGGSLNATAPAVAALYGKKGDKTPMMTTQIDPLRCGASKKVSFEIEQTVYEGLGSGIVVGLDVPNDLNPNDNTASIGSIAPKIDIVLQGRNGNPGEVVLSWTGQIPNNAQLKLEKSTDGAGGWIEIGAPKPDANLFSDRGLECGKTIFYRLAVNQGEKGISYSNTVSIETPSCFRGKPRDLKVTALADNAIKLTWAYEGDGGQGFLVERSLDGTNWTAIGRVPVTTREFTDVNLKCGTLFIYRISVFDNSGASVYADAPAWTGTADCDVSILSRIMEFVRKLIASIFG